ncbi:MAG: hypothetical protein EOO90_19965 [Pedobacter sp.]|nr:MAG: hypothetical protein EOO90_19965 [Pedobacter sp.]
MKFLTARKYLYLFLNLSICLSFGFFALFSPFTANVKAPIENMSELPVENDESPNEVTNHFFMPEAEVIVHHASIKDTDINLWETDFSLPSFSISPSTPPPNLS